MSSQLSAIELLNLGDEGREKTVLTKFWPSIIGISLGVAGACFVNFQTRRPAFSGIMKHVIGAGGLTVIFTKVQQKRDDYLAEKDAVYRHYVSLHPEDFVEPVPQKIADILEPWIPIR